MQCPECGIQLEETQSSCPDCGAELIGNLNANKSSKVYTCENCNEELEYISTYKQWYCYNCQVYVDLPAPGDDETESERSQTSTDIKGTGSITEIEHNDMLEKEENDDFDTGPKDESQEDIENESDDWLNDDDEDFDWEVDSDGSETDASFELDEGSSLEEDAEIVVDNAHQDEKPESFDEAGIEYDEVDDIYFSPQQDENLRHEIEDIEPEPVLELGESTIEEVGIEEIEIEFQEDDFGSDLDEDSDEDLPVTPELKKNAMTKLQAAWFRLNSIKENYPNNEQLLSIEAELKDLLSGDNNPRDVIIIADECLEEMNSIEKELQQDSFGDVTNLFHFVNSKIALAKKVGFDVTDLEDDLDNISSFIAMSKFNDAKTGLIGCIDKIRRLPNEQDEILIGLEEDSEQIKDLLEPMPGESGKL
jgi:hypothetical protein